MIFVVQPRYDFPVTHWWRGEAIWDYYKLECLKTNAGGNTPAGNSKTCWPMAPTWVDVPMLNFRREPFKRPCQLLVVNETAPGQ